jgi:hypothetical protein
MRQVPLRVLLAVLQLVAPGLAVPGRGGAAAHHEPAAGARRVGGAQHRRGDGPGGSFLRGVFIDHRAWVPWCALCCCAVFDAVVWMCQGLEGCERHAERAAFPSTSSPPGAAAGVPEAAARDLPRVPRLPLRHRPRGGLQQDDVRLLQYAVVLEMRGEGAARAIAGRGGPAALPWRGVGLFSQAHRARARPRAGRNHWLRPLQGRRLQVGLAQG